MRLKIISLVGLVVIPLVIAILLDYAPTPSGPGAPIALPKISPAPLPESPSSAPARKPTEMPYIPEAGPATPSTTSISDERKEYAGPAERTDPEKLSVSESALADVEIEGGMGATDPEGSPAGAAETPLEEIPLPEVEIAVLGEDAPVILIPIPILRLSYNALAPTEPAPAPTVLDEDFSAWIFSAGRAGGAWHAASYQSRMWTGEVSFEEYLEGYLVQSRTTLRMGSGSLVDERHRFVAPAFDVSLRHESTLSNDLFGGRVIPREVVEGHLSWIHTAAAPTRRLSFTLALALESSLRFGDIAVYPSAVLGGSLTRTFGGEEVPDPLGYERYTLQAGDQEPNGFSPRVEAALRIQAGSIGLKAGIDVSEGVRADLRKVRAEASVRF